MDRGMERGRDMDYRRDRGFHEDGFARRERHGERLERGDRGRCVWRMLWAMAVSGWIASYLLVAALRVVLVLYCLLCLAYACLKC